MTAGYSGSPLVRKLGIKENYRCVFSNVPDHYGDLVADIPPVDLIEADEASDESIDFIHLFSQFPADLEKNWDLLKPLLKKSGSFWVSWPKGSSQIPNDLDGNKVRTFGLKKGLVDVKVCAVDEDWSGLKFMYRKEDR